MSLQSSILLLFFLQCEATNPVFRFSSVFDSRVLVQVDIAPPHPGPPAPSPSPPPPPPPPRRLTRAPPPPPPPPSHRYYSYSSAGSGSPFKSLGVLIFPLFGVMIIFICICIRGGDGRGRTGHDTGTANGPTAPSPASQIQAPQDNAMIQGLENSFVSKLPTLHLSATRSRADVQDNQKRRSKDYYSCAVCISDYEEGDTLKLLPACGHCFHKDCIDMWLVSHSTCPLCRLSLFDKKGDLILFAEEEEECPSFLQVDVEATAPAQPRYEHALNILPLIKMLRRSKSCVECSPEDRMARTDALDLLRRSSSQPAGGRKVWPS